MTDTSRRVTRIAGLRRAVTDLQRAIDFHCGALGFRVATAPVDSGAGKTVRLVLGNEHIDLVQHAAAAAWACAPDPRFQHAAIVASDMAAAHARLLSFGPVAITEGPPQTLPADTGSVTAYKFRDPDGHPLELIHFPAGSGSARWQASGALGPTLGIDHFALAVADVEASLDFFVRTLGLRMTARSQNHGPAQDRLDGLCGVTVDVVALAADGTPATPHLELLGYRSPAPQARSPVPAGHLADAIVCVAEQADGEAADPDGHRFVFIQPT